MEQKSIFNLHLTFEDALQGAKNFQASYKDKTGEDLRIWEDPRGFYNERIKIRTDEFYPLGTFDANVAEMYEVGTLDAEAKAALVWLMQRHKGFNPLELDNVIVGRFGGGIQGDTEVAIFAYLSRQDDCLRDFITEKGFELTEL